MAREHVVLHGDNLPILQTLDSQSFDALVTDPPSGIAFLGAEWDKDKGGRDQWIAWLARVMFECLRVLKVGAYGAVWALPRTSHWTAMAIENAGFEVVDVVTHIFGSGFPKNHDIAKAIDRRDPEAWEKRPKLDMPPPGMRSSWDEGDGNNWNGRTARGGSAVLDEAKAWEGFGTGLKPASEHWIIVHKPSGETFADSVLKNGVGAINIGAGRIPHASAKLGRWPSNVAFSHSVSCEATCASDCPVAELDRQSGERPGMSGGGTGRRDASMFGIGGVTKAETVRSDRGGASRFFYVAKPSRGEKDVGDLKNEHPTVKSIDFIRWITRMVTPKAGRVIDPFMGSGTTGVAALREGCSFVGIELSKEFQDLAIQRIGRWHVDHKKLRALQRRVNRSAVKR